MSAIENAASNVIKKLKDNKIQADILNSKDYKDFAQYFKNGVKEKDLDPDFKSAFNNYTQYYKEIMNNSKKAEKNFIQVSFNDEQNENSKNSRDASDELFKLLMQTKLNLVKDALELEGVFFGKTTNIIIYDNELVDKPLSFGGGAFGGGAYTLGTFNMANLDLNSFDIYNAGNYNIKRGVEYRMSTLRRLDAIMPESFRNMATDFARRNGLPPILFMFISLSEGGFKDAPTNSLGYGGYFGQPTAKNMGYGAPFEVQANALIGDNFRYLIRQGIPTLDAMALTYVAHHLPVIGKNIWRDTGGKPWRTNPSELASLLNEVYNKHMKDPMSATRLAEAMTVNLYAQCAMAYISKAPELKKYF